MLGDQLIGFSCCVVAGVGFAVNYIPVKRMDTGDGVFFAAAMSLGIVIVGVITGFMMSDTQALALPKFEPLAAVGGSIWMLGNLLCPYIIRLVGLGLGLTVWDLSNMITGWFTGFFGLFGVQRELVLRPQMNCLGVSLAAFSLVFFSMAASADLPGKPPAEGKPDMDVVVESPGLGSRSPTESTADSSAASPDLEANNDGESPQCLDADGLKAKAGEGVAPEEQGGRSQARAMPLGLFLAMVAGIFFGTTFDLPTDLSEGNFGPGHSSRVLDYVWSHFLGIFATAILALAAYVAVMRRKSYMPKALILPAVASGVLWAIAQVAWFQANASLGYAIAFPIIASLPGILGLFIGTCFFGEMKSSRSRLLALLGLLLRCPGVALIAVSV
ncbi:TMEM144 [Symbiodinium natans]|uniref:TMEM144 protein n=1 Tax=Symbiodinium natans TaxID=878477 RepID=A0A812MDW6_9DINO|nr:TMEM144 [Symbiodinium natans]